MKPNKSDSQGQAYVFLINGRLYEYPFHPRSISFLFPTHLSISDIQNISNYLSINTEFIKAFHRYSNRPHQ